MSIGVVVFPGSNCDRDVQWATEGCLGMPTRRLWHEDTDLSGLEAVILPGGAVSELPPYTRGVLSGQVQGYGGQTPYIQLGNKLIVGLALLMLLLAWGRNKAARIRH